MHFEPKLFVTSILAFQVDFRKTPQLSVPPRPFHSFTFRHTGSASFEADGQVLLSKPGTITFMPAGKAYKTELLENGGMYALHFTAATAYPNLSPAVLPVNATASFERLFSDICACCKAGQEPDYRCLSLFYKLLQQLEAEQMRNIPPIPKRMQTAKARIDASFAAPLTIDQLAEDAHVSCTWFRQEFKRCYGISPLSYLKQVRMEHAKALLSTGLYPVWEVATRCGFDSISYFSYEFHRLTGVTPTEYASSV